MLVSECHIRFRSGRVIINSYSLKQKGCYTGESSGVTAIFVTFFPIETASADRPLPPEKKKPLLGDKR